MAEEDFATRPGNVPAPPDRPVGSDEIAELVASVRAGVEVVAEPERFLDVNPAVDATVAGATAAARGQEAISAEVASVTDGVAVSDAASTGVAAGAEAALPIMPDSAAPWLAASGSVSSGSVSSGPVSSGDTRPRPADSSAPILDAQVTQPMDEAVSNTNVVPDTSVAPDDSLAFGAGAAATASAGVDDSSAAGPRVSNHVGAREAPRRSGLGAALREIAIVVVAALAISALVRTFLVQAFWVPSGSMENTLIRNDRILAWKPATPGRGDVVVFHDPADWLVDAPARTGLAGQIQRALVFVGIMPSSSGDDLVKRVIGVGGDTVECCSVDGKIIRNGVALDEPYIYPGDSTDQIRFKVTVPEGRLFVMGDHRSDSADSRFHMEYEQGTVPVSSVVGRAVVIMWPPSRWATLPDYQGAAGGR